MGVEELRWRFGLGAIFVVYRRRNQNVKGCCYDIFSKYVCVAANKTSVL